MKLFISVILVVIAAFGLLAFNSHLQVQRQEQLQNYTATQAQKAAHAAEVESQNEAELRAITDKACATDPNGILCQ